MALDDVKAAHSDNDDKPLSSIANSEMAPAEETSDDAVDEASEKPAGERAADEKSSAAVSEREEPKDYVKGFKLIAVMAVVTTAAFLMLLDMSIIATVRNQNPFSLCPQCVEINSPCPGCPTNHDRVPLAARRWLVRRRVQPCEVRLRYPSYGIPVTNALLAPLCSR